MKTLLWLCPLLLLGLFPFATPAVSARPAQQAPACTTASPSSNPTIGPTPTVCISITYDDNPVNPYTAIAVSWLSQTAETGYVKVSGQSAAFDLRGQNFSGRTHFVELLNLAPNTAYQFDIVSGNKTFDNSGQHWNIHTGAALAPSRAQGILGEVKNPDGNPATEAVVYVTVQRTTDQATAAPLAQLVSVEDGSFFAPLANARAALDGAKFDFVTTRDKAIITAVGGPGFASTTVRIDAALPPQPNPPNVSLTLGTGYVTSATATPSPLPPTSTWTPVTPSLTPTLIPATATAMVATETAEAWTATPTATRRLPSATRAVPSATWTTVPTPTLEQIVETMQAETKIAEATIEANGGTPEPTSIRVAPPAVATATPGSFLGLDVAVSVFVLLAIGAFGIAALLGIVALWIWKR